MSQARQLGYQYLADLWLKTQRRRILEAHLADCRNSPTLQGEGAAQLIQAELYRRQHEHEPAAP